MPIRLAAPVKVAFVAATLGIGGSERLQQNLIDSMDPAQIDPCVVTLSDAGPIGEELRRRHRVWSRIGRDPLDPATGLRLRKVLRKAGIQVVYTTDSPLPLFWCGMLRRARPTPKLVIGFHSTGTLGFAIQHGMAMRAALPVADRLVALSAGHRSFLARQCDIPPERLDVLSSGVDCARFHPAPDRMEPRRLAGLPQNGPLVGLVAAMRPEKNHEMFLRLAKRLENEHPGARFLMIGDGPERARIAEMAASHRNVEMLGQRSDVPEIVRALDIMVLCSHPVVETMPLTVMESLASGTPAVCTDVGSVSELVREGETGFLVPPENDEALARAVSTLLADAELRGRFGARAREDAEQRFALDEMARRYERLFIETAAG